MSVVKNNNYSAKDIEILEGLEPVRKRPGMYIGGTDETAFHHLATNEHGVLTVHYETVFRGAH
ncbi:MAG: hypothetical protein EBV52_03350 [Candidatus Fonsibacter lacus]|nr:hypothetical protein [Candidatus Fonsibacter lacus]